MFKIKIMNKLICLVASGSNTEESPFKLDLNWTKPLQAWGAGRYIQEGCGLAAQGISPEQQAVGRHQTAEKLFSWCYRVSFMGIG